MSIVRIALTCLMVSLCSGAALSAQRRVDSTPENQRPDSVLSLARQRDAIPLQLASFTLAVLRRPEVAGTAYRVGPLAAGITDSGRIALIEGSSSALWLFEANGHLAQKIDGVRNTALAPDAELASGPWSEIFVRVDSREILRFARRDAQYQRIGTIPASLDLSAMCYMNGWLVLAGWDSVGNHQMHVVDRRTGTLVRALRSTEPGESRVSREAAQHERLACDPNNDMIYLVSSGTSVTLRAFSLLGQRLWQRRIADPPLNAEPHPASLVAVLGRGVLLQFRLDSVATTTSTPFVRNYLTAFFNAKDGATIVDRNLWARAIGTRGNLMLWASDGTAKVIPPVLVSWIAPY